MGALLSFPITSVLALPLFTSSTTSMNLLFFMVNWYLLLLTHTRLNVELYGLTIVRLLFFLLPALLLLGFDSAVPSLAEQIKAQPATHALPLSQKGGARKVLRILAWSVLNTLMGVGLTMGLEILFERVLMAKSMINVGKLLPFPWQAVQDVAWGLVLRGSLQYLIHRCILHNPRFVVARWHKQWQHSVPVPFSLVAAYDHPVPYLLHHWVPLYLPALYFRTHLLPFLVILTIASLEEVMTYSGYSVLPSPILAKGMARRVDLHFLSRGRGNFAAFGLIDWICGTSLGTHAVTEDLRQEWDKHDMDGKIQDGAEKGVDVLQNVVQSFKGMSKRRSGRKVNGSN